MSKTVMQFLLDACQWPLGAQLATAAGTAADPKEGVKMVIELMKKEGVFDKEITQETAQAIYTAVRQFIQNTDFSAPLYKPKYWTRKAISCKWDPYLRI